MSYDILVFTPSAVSDDALSAWLTEQVEGVDGDSCDPAVTTPALRAFYEDMHQIFPPVNGPDRVDEEVLGDLPATDYSFGPNHVYVSVSWDGAARAVATAETIDMRHAVAVSRVSEAGSVMRP